jgi:hypothetical protein
MKIIVFILIGLGLSQAQTAKKLRKPATPSSIQDERDYGVGSALGVCMVVECKVFAGTIISDSPKPGELAVTVGIEERLFGVPSETKMIVVRYLSTPAGSGLDPQEEELRGEALDAKLVRGEHLTVVLPLGRGYRAFPGIPVLVTANQRDEETIRSLLKDAEHLRCSPDQTDQMAASLSYTPNPSLAGLLYAYLMQGTKRYTNEQMFAISMPLLPHLIGSDADLWATFFVPGGYPALSSSNRAALVQRLAELAPSTDPHLARGAVSGLMMIGDHEPAAIRMIPPSSLASVESKYQELVKNGKLPRSPSFEKEISVSP